MGTLMKIAPPEIFFAFYNFKRIFFTYFVHQNCTPFKVKNHTFPTLKILHRIAATNPIADTADLLLAKSRPRSLTSIKLPLLVENSPVFLAKARTKKLPPTMYQNTRLVK